MFKKIKEKLKQFRCHHQYEPICLYGSRAEWKCTRCGKKKTGVLR